MREIADVHRELFAEHAELYGENIRPKIERCLEITDAEAPGRRTSVTTTGAEPRKRSAAPTS